MRLTLAINRADGGNLQNWSLLVAVNETPCYVYQSEIGEWRVYCYNIVILSFTV